MCGPSGGQAEAGQGDLTPGEGNLPTSDQDVKGKKAPSGARARSIKTPLQREALEAAYLSE